ncbi:hypothetical protein PR048_008752 [Dryococelus australis]|uniref:Uncharacterized protein n=1 Tax=Dryococelus australis TaxID=614101 RepID=A0ABQ9HYV6_9NEOP|nr:hypothetical protein PR048_008752 [Dryococelus australis]
MPVDADDITQTMYVSRWMVHQVLCDEKYNSYQYATMQHLLPADHPCHAQFYQWLLQHEADHDFVSCTLWTNEACFKCDSTMNSNNHSLWDQLT